MRHETLISLSIHRHPIFSTSVEDAFLLQHSFGFVVFCFFVFKTGFLCVAMVVLELIL